MSNQKAEISYEKDGLGPIPFDNKHRILGPVSYLMAWLGGCVSIGNFSLGSSLVGGGLNLMQVILAIALGSGLVSICLVINDKLCYTTGMPYVVQLRSAFGFNGTAIPAICRGLPAIVWYGFQSWVGASALNEISVIIFNFDSMIFYFILFHLLQVGLAVLGFKGIKAIENIGGVVIILSLAYMLITMLTMHGDSVAAIANAPANWGVSFFSAVTSFIGVNCLVLISVGDYVREVKPGCGPIARGGIYAAALIPATVFMGVIGLLVTNVTGIANPVVGFARVVDNKLVVILTLIFIIFAQITTNLLNNSLPPIYALMDLCKLKHKTAAIIVGLMAFATFPWELIKESSASGLNFFILIYSAFAGPIFAILVTDFYIVRKQRVSMPDFYNPEGPFKGINRAAIGALIIGAAVSFLLVDISWLASIIPTSVAYYLLSKKTAVTL
jgi:NCS1 family nucleobase:cation symporter-1